MKYLAALIFLAGCSSVPVVRHNYLVKTTQGSFLCDEFYTSPYGQAAKSCEHVLLGYKVDSIPNPVVVTIIEE